MGPGLAQCAMTSSKGASTVHRGRCDHRTRVDGVRRSDGVDWQGIHLRESIDLHRSSDTGLYGVLLLQSVSGHRGGDCSKLEWR